MGGGNFVRGVIAGVVVAAATVMTGGTMTAAVVMGGLAALSVMLVPKPKVGGLNMKPASLSDFQVTRTQEGTPLPMIYGQSKLPSTIIWYGNLKVVEIKERVGGGGKGGGGGSKSQTVGFKYYLDVFHFIGIGKLELVKVFENDREISIDNVSYIFNDGTSNVYVPQSMTGVSDWEETTYPGCCWIFFKQWYVGENNTYLKPMHFLVRRDLSIDSPLPYANIIK